MKKDTRVVNDGGKKSGSQTSRNRKLERIKDLAITPIYIQARWDVDSTRKGNIIIRITRLLD